MGELAEAAGSEKSANMVMLGAYVGASGVVSGASVEHAIELNFGGKKAVAETALAAYRRGFELGRAAVA